MSSTDPGAVAIYVAERDLADVAVELGATYLSVEGAVGLSGGVADSLATVTAPGRLGAIIVGAVPSAKAGTVTLTVRVRASTLALAASVLETLGVWLAQGSVSLRSSLGPAREARARLVDPFSKITDEPYNNTAKLVATFTLDDPLWYALAPTVLALRKSVSGVGQRVAMPMGTAPSNPLVTIYGPSTSPINLIYRDSQGVIVSTLALAVSLTSSEFLTIDTSVFTIVKTSSGVAGTVPAGIALIDNTTGALYPVLDPEDGDRYAQVAPTLELTDAGNTATGRVSYTKAYR